MEPLDLAIVGAGPSGLAAAIAAAKAGLDYVVLEKGALVEAIYRFPRQMTFFTTPDLLEIGGLPFVTPYEKPTQGEALRYYRRVAETYDLHIEMQCAVRSLRRTAEGFRLAVSTPKGEAERAARNVVLATGYYDHPNLLGIPGEDRPHVSHYWTEAHAFWRKPVVVVGGKNSAAIAALELHRAGAKVTLVHRGEALSGSIKYWIKPDIENRIKEGAIAARLRTRVTRIEADHVLLSGPTGEERRPADAVFLLTGYTPDVSLLQGVGVEIDPGSLKPTLDPSSFETNVPGLFVAGALASGRETSKIFIENGRFHGEAIVKAIVARLAAVAGPG